MQDCIFCKIVAGELPSDKVYEDENIYAFKDIDPQAPVHVVIVPKEHYKSVLEVEDGTVYSNLVSAAKEIARDLGLTDSGFRIVINTGEDGGQTVDHLHLHLLGERELQWPPG